MASISRRKLDKRRGKWKLSPSLHDGGSVKKLLAVVGLGLVTITAVVAWRTARFGIGQVSPVAVRAVAIPEGASARLAGAVRIPTISHEDTTAFDARAFLAMHSYLEKAFPLAHRQLRREVVATHSLLYEWKGTDPGLAPILLAAHLDVVPVEPGTDSTWQQQPFSGNVSGGFIWGRGSIDNKAGVVGTLEAVEMLLAEDFRPARTVYLAFGHDEEIGGRRGAREIAALLGRRGIRPALVLDEGGFIGEGIIAGVPQATALVGIAEKGFASLELATSAPGGHSSVPPPQTTIGVLAAAIARLEANPMPARITEATRQLLARVGPLVAPGQRLALANLWLTRPLILKRFEQSRTTNAMIRTTTAVTVFQAGTKDNVLAGSARAVANFRIIQGDSIAGVVDHVRRVIDDQRIEVRVAGAFSAEPSAVSSTESEQYRVLEGAIRKTAPEAVVAPYLVVVVSDSRHYASLTTSVLRFLPLPLGQSDLPRIHGTDERVAIADYERAIRFYRTLIVDAAGG